MTETPISPFPLDANPERGSMKAMFAALSEAEKAFATPNPNVGCVLMKNGVCVGRGHTQPVGGAHAEVMALREAGDKARGATAHVTLEPCSHFGRTPPCTDALIAAGIAKVVIATLDNDLRVSGNGVRKLHGAGIPTVVLDDHSGTNAELLEQVRCLNEDFFHYNAMNSTFVTLKAAMTLDGKIATATGDSKWITGNAARQHVHTMRAKSGAVLVGIGTLLADDAQLTARAAEGKTAYPRQPLRIIVDSHLRTPPDCAAVRLAEADPQTQPLLIATTEAAPNSHEAALKRDGVEILRLPPNDTGRVPLSALLQTLAQRKLISVLVEGGGEIHAAFLRERLAHKIAFFLAPKLLGGKDSPTAFEGANPLHMAEALALSDLTTSARYPPDILIEGYLR